MPADVELNIYQSRFQVSKETFVAEKTAIHFEQRCDDLSKESKADPIKKVDPPKGNGTLTTGLPKNARLSALASKRNVNRAKRNTTITCEQTGEVEKGSVERLAKKKYDLSCVDRRAFNQNLSHMATQVRAKDAVGTGDIILLTQGLHCEEKPLQRCFRHPSRGMRLLFPGKDKTSRRRFIDALHCSPVYNQFVGERILPAVDPSRKLTPFDFSTCPFEAVAAADRLELEAARKKRKTPKRLVACRPASKARNAEHTHDPLSAKRLLKNRVKAEPDRSLRIVICGSPSSGKSTLLSTLLRFYDPASFPEKHVSKVKWEAEKVGRPRDYSAWLIDELPEERRCGHSWYLTETSVTLQSGQPCQLFDCPGNQLPLLSDLLPNAHAIVMVLDVNRRLQVRDCLKMITERSNWPDCQLIVVLNQMDRCSYSTKQANATKQYFTSILSETVGNRIEKKVLFIPACAATGEGLVPSGREPRPENGRVTFNACLADALENMKLLEFSLEPSPVDLKAPVLRVRDVYENMGAGFTAVADVMQGLVAPGQSLVCLPSEAPLTIRSVQIPKAGRLVTVKCAAVGESVHLVLWQVDMSAVKAGSVICPPSLSSGREGCVQVGARVEARIEIVNLNGCALFPGRRVMFHSFAATIPAFVRRLLWVGVAPDAVKLKPMAVSRCGATVSVELVLESPHICSPSLGIGLDFALMANESLMATGVISRLLEEETASNDCCYRKRLVFHRSGGEGAMQVD